MHIYFLQLILIYNILIIFLSYDQGIYRFVLDIGHYIFRPAFYGLTHHTHIDIDFGFIYYVSLDYFLFNII